MSTVHDLEIALTDLIVSVSDSPWLPTVLFLVIFIDGLLPFLPVEAAIIALLSWSHSTGTPPLPLVMGLAASGALAGDTLAYLVGRGAASRPPSGLLSRWHAGITRQFDQRGAMILLTARFVPVGRVVATLSAGATRLPYKRFLVLSALSSILWTLWVTALGVAGSLWLGQSPILAAVLAVVLGAAGGAVVDQYSRRRRKRRVSPASGPNVHP